MLPNWIIAALAAAFTGLVGYAAHYIDVTWLEARQAAALTAQAIALDKQCDKDKQKTLEVDNALHKQDAITVGSYDNAIRMLDGKDNQPVPTGRTGGGKPTTSNTRLYYTDPAAARAILARMKIAQLQTDQLVACQQLLIEERKP